MGASGSFYAYDSNNTYKYRLIVDWVQTNNAYNNTSTLDFTFRLIKGIPQIPIATNIEATVDGVYELAPVEKTPYATGTFTLGTYSTTVHHENDGTKTLTMSFYYAIGNGYSGCTATATVVLDSNPAVSTASLSSAAIGSTATITINRFSEAYTTGLSYTFGSASGTIEASPGTSASSVSWTPPVSLANQIPNATSGTGTLICTTYADGVAMNSTTSTFTLTVPSSTFKPAIGSLTATNSGSDASNSWGVFVQSKSSATIAMQNVTANGGATIQSYSISGGSFSGSTSSLSIPSFPSSGTITFTATVTDSRGYTSEAKTCTVTVYPYNVPGISDYSAYRCDSTGVSSDDGTYVRLGATFLYAECNGNNSVTAAVKYKQSTVGTWTDANVNLTSGGSVVFGGGNISTDNSYDVQISLTDAFTTTTTVIQIPTASVLMDFLFGGKGLAIGKVAENENMLEVAWDTKLNGVTYIGTNDVGSETQPVYLDAGVVTACSASIPTSTSQLTNDSGFITTSDIPEGSAATTTVPAMDGTAAVGTEMAFARGDHVHPTDTSRAPTSHASTATTYGKGTSSNYGHVKLSDSTTDTTAAASGGTAATPKAVSDALTTAKTYSDDITGGITDDMDILKGVMSSLSALADDNFGTDATQVISGYNSQNASEAKPRNAPFIPEPFITEQGVSWIKLNVITAGTLTVGCYKESDIVLNSEYLQSSYIELMSVDVSTTGEQTLTFSPSVYIPSGYVLAICTASDVCTFAYGDYGTTKSYYWFENSTPRIVRQSTGKSLGLDIGCIEYNAMSGAASSTVPAMDGTASVGIESTFARGDHVHPTDTSRAPASHATSATTYGVGTSSNYGHLKLSDSTSSTSSTSDGIAATPAAVKAAYDLANSKTANTGTVTSITTGDGLSGGTITQSGTISVSYGTGSPAMDGTADAGSATTAARSDHVHPTDTSRAAATDVSLLKNVVTSTSSFTDDYFGIDSTQVISGYNTSNSSSAKPRNAPFIPQPFISGQGIKWIKLNVLTAGTLTIGCYKESDIVLSGEYYESSYMALRTITISTTGEQTLTFSPSIYIPDGYALAICTSDDTCTFAYGNYGTNKSYYWVNNTSPKTISQSTTKSLGLDVGCMVHNRSVFAGEKISIFGDSISTYADYVPSGNAVYYTGSNSGVSSVDDTWWKKAIDALQFDLLINNSWSGRAVSSIRDSTSGHTTDAGYKEANVVQLKDGSTLPDVIIVKLGINDFNYECPLGTYEGKTAVPSDPSTFTNAYAMMLDLIMTNFPLARVYCCTLMPCEKNGTIGFPEINGNGNTITEFNDAIRKLAHAFGAEVLNHDVCGLTYYNLSTYMGDYSSSTQNGLHPNAAGHSLIANKTISEMDPAIRIRY